MDKTIRRVTDLQAQREETYRYWQSRSAAERMNAVAEIVKESYSLKGIEVDRSSADRTLIRRDIREWKAALLSELRASC